MSPTSRPGASSSRRLDVTRPGPPKVGVDRPFCEDGDPGTRDIAGGRRRRWPISFGCRHTVCIVAKAAFPVESQLVVIGSSAGGIEALSRVVASLPADFPAPIVIAQHLDPRRPAICTRSSLVTPRCRSEWSRSERRWRTA